MPFYSKGQRELPVPPLRFFATHKRGQQSRFAVGVSSKEKNYTGKSPTLSATRVLFFFFFLDWHRQTNMSVIQTLQRPVQFGVPLAQQPSLQLVTPMPIMQQPNPNIVASLPITYPAVPVCGAHRLPCHFNCLGGALICKAHCMIGSPDNTAQCNQCINDCNERLVECERFCLGGTNLSTTTPTPGP